MALHVSESLALIQTSYLYTPLLSVCSTEEWKSDFPTYQSLLCFLCLFLTWETNHFQLHLTWPNQRGCSNPMHVHRQCASR